VSELLALRVGPAGRVHAVDESERWIAHLAARLAGPGAPEGAERIRPHRVRLEELDRAALGLGPDRPGDSPARGDAGVDGVFVRWVLSFPRDPGAIVARLAALLRPGGRLVAVDYNHEGVSLFPESPGFRAVVDATRALYARTGGDAFVAGRFPALFRAAGLRLESLEPHAIAGGPGSPAFEWADTFWTHHCHRMEAQGLLSPAHKARFLAEWDERRGDPDALFFSPLVVHAVGVREP
jgi:SAM-dependent methyltransferase